MRAERRDNIPEEKKAEKRYANKLYHRNNSERISKRKADAYKKKKDSK